MRVVQVRELAREFGVRPKDIRRIIFRKHEYWFPGDRVMVEIQESAEFRKLIEGLEIQKTLFDGLVVLACAITGPALVYGALLAAGVLR